MSKGPNDDRAGNDALSDGKANMWKGAFWCCVGVVGSVFNSMNNTGFGGTVVVSWGALVNGLYLLVKGLIEVDKVRQSKRHNTTDISGKSAITEMAYDRPAHIENSGGWRRMIFNVWLWVVLFVVMWQIFES